MRGALLRLVTPRLAALGLLAALLCACGGKAATEPPASAADAPVHNFAWVSPRVARGAQPEGEAAFAFLAARGIRTIVSVDGARPDVETASRHGLRTVHIPFGYDSVPPEDALRIAKTVRELPGPVFVHCHHGKHRGPVAAVIAEIALGDMTVDAAKAELARAGTDPHYEGLGRSVGGFRTPSEAETRACAFDFPEVAPVPALTASMSILDRRMDGLAAIRDAGFATPPAHPDLTPEHEALQVEELLRELGRTPETAARPADFRRFLSEAEAAAGALRAALSSPSGKGDAETAWRRLRKSCAACHDQYRDR